MSPIHYSKVPLTHATLNCTVDVVIGTIAAYFESDTKKCTFVLTSAGQIPVKESRETITKLINEAASINSTQE